MMLCVLLILPRILLVEACPEIDYSPCNNNEEITCWGGYDANGCSLQSSCIPRYNGMTGDDGAECENNCHCDGSKGQVYCPLPSNNGCQTGYCAHPQRARWSDYASFPLVDCPARCDTRCKDDEMYCDNGYDCNGCHLGNHCAKSNGDCPARCSPTCNYKIGEQRCDNGYDENGCWMGAHCASECPSDCPPITTVECGYDEMKCGGVLGGLDGNGCIMAESCIPRTNGTGDDGHECWSRCPIFCDPDDGKTYCEYPSYNGCYYGGYCAVSKVTGRNGKRCTGVCTPNCDYQAGYKYMYSKGYDDNGCWLGFRCEVDFSPGVNILSKI